MAGDEYKYWAFISYSHRDRAWADWLHKTLETYRVPSRLVGRETRHGQIPARMFPIFRDRDELPSSANLGDALAESLRQSRYQIVICSPRSAASRWVEEEVKYFGSLGRKDRQLCLIVDGEPNVFQVPGRDLEECFGPSLRAPAEPIAADAREHADGKAGAKLKLIAGLIGVGLDELIQRERARQRWRKVQMAAAALAFAGLCAGAWQWYLNKTAAREREITIERLVEGGRQELLEGRQARAAVLLNQAYKMGHDSVALRFMLARAMQPVEALTKVRIQHEGFDVYRSAAFSGDGRHFALGGISREKDPKAVVRIFDAATGALEVTLPAAVAMPVTTQFFAGGQRLLMAGFPDERGEGAPVTRIWKLAAPQESLRIAGLHGLGGLPLSADGTRVLIAAEHGLEVRSTDDGHVLTTYARGRNIAAATYSSDGAAIALADAAGAVEILSPSDGRVSVRFKEAAGQTTIGLAFTRDGTHLLALSSQGDVHNWNIETKLLQSAFAADPTQVTSFQPDREGTRLLTIGVEGYKVWSVARGSLLFSIPRLLSAYASAALSPDGDTLLIADDQSTVAEAWDVRSRQKLYSLDLHNSILSGAAFDPDGGRLLLASRDGDAETWRMPIIPAWKYQSFETLPHTARFSRDGQRLLVGGGYETGSVSLIDFGGGAPIHQEGHKGLVYDARFNSAQDRIVSASRDGSAALWDAGLSKQLARLEHPSQQLYSARFSGDDQRILTQTTPEAASHADQAGLWDGRDGRFIAWLPHDDIVRDARFDPSGQRIVTGGQDRVVKIWDAQDGRLLRTLTGPAAWVVSAGFSADGARVLAASEDNTVRVWDAQSGASVLTLDDPGLGVPTQAIFSPKGDTIAVGTESGTIWLWTPATGARLALKGHQQPVNALQFSADGALLFSGGYDGTVRAWDPKDGAPLGVIAVHDRQLTTIDLNADGTRIASTSWGQVKVSETSLERRSAMDVGSILECQSPWSIDATGLGLSPAAINRAKCGNPAQK